METINTGNTGIKNGGNLHPYRIVPELDDNLMGPNAAKMDELFSKSRMFITRKNVFMAYGVVTLISLILMATIDNGITNPISLILLNGIALITGVIALRATLPVNLILFLVNILIYTVNGGLNKYAIFALFIVIFINRVGPELLSRNSNINTASNLECTYPVWGVAGEHVGANVDFKEAGVIGAKGEAMVAKELEKLPEKYPHVRLFNGVKFIPFSDKPWDVDHVILIGRKVYFIDAKFWSIASYSWNTNNDGEDVIFKNGEWWKPGEVHMTGAMDAWLEYLNGGVEIYARTTLAQAERNGYHYNFDNSRAPRGQAVTSIELLMEELSNVAENSDRIVDRNLVYLFKNNLHG